jgi:hypothetical protein
MAIVLFEGFERPFNSDVWTLTIDPAQVASDVANGGAGDNTIWNYVGRYPQNFGGVALAPHYTFAPTTMRASFTAQTGKTIYLGIAASELRSAPSAANLGPENRLPFVSFRAANGAEQIVIGFEHSATDPGYDTFGAYALHVPTNTYAHYNIPAIEFNVSDGEYYGVRVGSSPNYSSFNYLEVEITAGNTVAIRIDGRYLFTNGVAAASFSSISPIAQVEFYSFMNGMRYFDDMYLINNSGDAANSWLGPDTHVLPLAYPKTAAVSEWTHVPIDFYGDPYNVSDPDHTATQVSPLTADDFDTSYIQTSTFPRTQLYQVVPDFYFYSGNLNNFYETTNIGTARVLGMNFWTKARKTTQDSAYKFVYAPAASSSTLYDLSSSIPVTAVNYANKPVVYVEKNPATNAAWTLNDVYTDGLFGVQSVNPA